MERREFLTASGLLTVSGVISGCSGLSPDDNETPEEATPESTPEEATPESTPEEATPESTPEEPSGEHGIAFERVVDAVDDLGMDPTGSQPIDNIVEDTLDASDTLVEFPEGTYLWESELTAERANNWGLRGRSPRPDSVSFVTNSEEGKRLLTLQDSRNILLENLTLDYSRHRGTHLGLVLQVRDGLYVRNLRFVGFNPASGDGGIINLSPQVLDSEGSATVTGVVRTGGTDIRNHRHLTSNPNIPGIIWLGKTHRGTLTIRNSTLANAGENGIYASRTNGTVQVEGCTFRNNNQSSVRISGADSYVRDCEFVVDTANAHPDNEYAEGDYINPHAMMWESGTEGRAGATIENCEIVYRSRPANDRSLQAVRGLGSIGAFTVRNTRFLLDTADTTAIYAQDPENPSFGTPATGPYNVTIDLVNIISTGGGDRGAIRLESRPESLVTESCLELVGEQSGIVILDSHDCRIEQTNITTESEETVFSNADVDTRNLTYGNTC